MDQPTDTQIKPVFKPSSAQLERAAKIRRFNRLYIYFPVGLASAIVVLLVILLLIAALGIGTPVALETVSGIADSVIILAIIPTMVLCAILPLIFIAMSVQMKQRGIAPIHRTQLILWRLQERLGFIGFQIRRIMAKIREPLVRIYSRFAFFRALYFRLTRIFRQG